MLHTKLQGQWPLGSWEEDFKVFFYHIWAWWPPWSCDQDAADKLVPQLWKLLMKFGFDWPMWFLRIRRLKNFPYMWVYVKQVILGLGHFLPQGYNLNNLHQGPQDKATFSFSISLHLLLILHCLLISTLNRCNLWLTGTMESCLDIVSATYPWADICVC